jgi:predicted DNA-binding transcriptional regulator YafY
MQNYLIIAQPICVKMHIFEIVMPVNKNASMRYRIIDSLLVGGQKVKMEDLIARVSEELRDLVSYESKDISKRSIEYDLQQMKEAKPQGFGAPVIRSKGFVYYDSKTYSIFGAELNDDDISALLELFSIYDAYWSFPQTPTVRAFVQKFGKNLTLSSKVKGRVQFDINLDALGAKRLSQFAELIKKGKQASVDYEPFGKAVRKINVQPLLVKEFNNRWFLLCFDNDQNRFTNLPLDRIMGAPRANNLDIDSAKLTELLGLIQHMYGVSFPKPDQNPEKIAFIISPERKPYLETKPIHYTQRIENNEFAESIVTLRLYQSRELVQTLLSYGKDVAVIEPESLRQEMKKIIGEMIASYA